MQTDDFAALVWDYYAKHGRDLPWRYPESDGSFDPYKILVSEIMLQQTQVGRVIPKYQEFLQTFPTVQSLATAALGDVLRAWQGLGYNRRAKFLWQTAQTVVNGYNGLFPEDQKELTKLPGIGANTAGAICAYAFNQPVVFIETNIRTVYIHYFFANKDQVTDKQLLPLVAQTLDYEHPREFFWALMDYGSHLKDTIGNVSRLSKHYAKQSRFEGSKRQLRGQILRILSQESRASFDKLTNAMADDRLEGVLTDLTHEGLIVKKGGKYRLA